jgi:hypothetical protein
MASRESPIMMSPFPGMDPYQEHFWGDVHHAAITYSAAEVQRVLPSGLFARIDVREFVDTTGAQHIDRDWDEPVRQGYINILDAKSGRRVVTVIEILSPSNKLPGPGRDLYVKKQEELRAGGVSLVEIDLVRSGARVLSYSTDRIPEGHRTPYAACVRRGWKPSEIEYYRIPLRERLPAIRIPLRREDRDVALDLQAVLDRCYEEGRYGDDIDYREDPEPPLGLDDAGWAKALLREQGRR